ncbi:MAG TPA: FtsX-like permease family protein [Solirubrobacteraceae bacterium]|nr:FtsX-like permease family protein [Solirubrobacteraceae bacterium]
MKAHALMRPYALLYFYRRRLRVHAPEELFAAISVAAAVALVFATTVLSDSVTGSAAEVIHTVVGPATLQLRARDSSGLSESLLARAERLPGVAQAAPLLEQTATLTAPDGRRVSVDLAGADAALVVLDGLAHTLPTAALSPAGVGLSATSAAALGLATRPSTPGASSTSATVQLDLRGRAIPLPVSAVLGQGSFGALAQARVAVMPLARLQRLAGLRGHVTRILVRARPGRQAQVRLELQALTGNRAQVSPAAADLTLLEQALRPADQASEFFAAIAALLGFLLAFNALLLTVPERRQSIADLRLIGAKRSAIVQMFLFQTLCLGVAASLLGLLAGYALTTGVLHESSGYLAEAFTLGSHTALGSRPAIEAFAGGVLATGLASAVPLLDLRGGRILDVVPLHEHATGGVLGRGAQLRLAASAALLLALTAIIFALAPSLALLACALLALATVLAVPLVLAVVLRCARALAEQRPRMTILPVALSALRATTLRSLALAATGAVALFGGIALGGARNDLQHGIRRFAHGYSADADIWVTNPGDNQATIEFRPGGEATRIARVPGVARVQTFQGGFLALGDRRVWIIARPAGGEREVLQSQILAGDRAGAIRRLGEGGWIAVSKQIADEHHTGVGGTLVLPTPAGPVAFKIAATTTNLAWSPGAIFIDTADYSRLWSTTAPTALGVDLAPGADVEGVRRAILSALSHGASGNGLEVSTAAGRQARIDALTGEGLGQLGTIAALLLAAAILAMSAALTSAIWQRRISLAELRLSGVRSDRLRRVLLVESSLMLGAGAVTGGLAGIYGQLIIDGYLAHVTGFPVASLGASPRAPEIFVLVIVVVMGIAVLPGWLTSRVSPTLALNE